MMRTSRLLITAAAALALYAFAGTASGQTTTTTSAESYAGVWNCTFATGTPLPLSVSEAAFKSFRKSAAV